MAPKDCFLGAVRRRTMICCRNVRISASIAARDRNRSTTAHTMSLIRYLITDQHRPILGQPPANRFATGTRGSVMQILGFTVDELRRLMQTREVLLKIMRSPNAEKEIVAWCQRGGSAEVIRLDP